MKILNLAGALALVMILCAPAAAQDVPVKAPAGFAPVSADIPLSTSVVVTAGGAALTAPGRQVVTTCTAAGNVVIAHKDGTTVIVAASVGTSYWPEAAVQIVSATATCSYWIEK